MSTTFIERAEQIIMENAIKKYVLAGSGLIGFGMGGIGYLLGGMFGASLALFILTIAAGIVLLIVAPYDKKYR